MSAHLLAGVLLVAAALLGAFALARGDTTALCAGALLAVPGCYLADRGAL